MEKSKKLILLSLLGVFVLLSAGIAFAAWIDPILECVDRCDNGTYRAYFSWECHDYTSGDTVNLPAGTSDNFFHYQGNQPLALGQPSTFNCPPNPNMGQFGREGKAQLEEQEENKNKTTYTSCSATNVAPGFYVNFDGSELVWLLSTPYGYHTETASSASRGCVGGCLDFRVNVQATKIFKDGKPVKISEPVPIVNAVAYEISKGRIRENYCQITDAQCIDTNIIDAGVDYNGESDLTDQDGNAYPSSYDVWEYNCDGCVKTPDDGGTCWDGDGGWVTKAKIPTDGSAYIVIDGETLYITGSGKDLEQAKANTGCCPSDGAHRQFNFWINVETTPLGNTVAIPYSKKDKKITGSELLVEYPGDVIWHPELETFYYPFVFTSDEDWTVDVCAGVPEGYDIIGVYNEFGELIATSDCIQTFVAGETKIIGFRVAQTGSPPEWAMNVKIKARHGNGPVKPLDLNIPSYNPRAAEHAADRAQETAQGRPFQQVTGATVAQQPPQGISFWQRLKWLLFG